MTGKIQLRFLGHQVHVRENRDAHKGLLGDLRTPAGFSPGVIALAFFKAKREQEIREIHEMLTRTTERVMVVVAPAETELILAEFLDARGAVAIFPIRPLRLEKNLARLVAADPFQTFSEQFFRKHNSIRV